MARKKETVTLENGFEATIDAEEDELAAAFALIKRKIDEGHSFTSAEKDICIQATLDALAPTERPWFYEIAVINKLPLWATLWGQYRRCNEWGMAQAPICDPGWESSYSSVSEQYRLGEEICPICENVFTKGNPGQIFCSNPCGAEAERRTKQLEIQRSLEGTKGSITEAPVKFSTKFAEHFQGAVEDESESVRLDDDVADV